MKNANDESAKALEKALRESEPLRKLLQYQQRWVDDKSRFKMGLMARQTGKDFSAGVEGVIDCFTRETTWLIAAPSERQSLESLEKWKEWARELEYVVESQTDRRENDGNSQTLIKSSTIIFANGSRVIAVPGKPNTVRGYSANVLLTEFAFFEQPDATWRAMYPMINNPMRGGEKKIRLITTPNGMGNQAHKLWTKNYRSGGALSKWSCHMVTIHDAVAQGLKIDIDDLREGLDDPEAWAQEYELNFLDQSTVLLPYDLIATAEHAGATEMAPANFWETRHLPGPLVAGIDFGHKKDLTVMWTASVEASGFLMTREVLCLQNMPTDKQIELLAPRVGHCRRVSVDCTGAGTGLGDYLARKFGEYHEEKHRFGRVELVTFSNTTKVEMFSKLRMRFDARRVGIPVSTAVREDLHSVCRVALAGGGVTYRAPHNADGHADRCVALALCCRATEALNIPGVISDLSGILIGHNPCRMGVFYPTLLNWDRE